MHSTNRKSPTLHHVKYRPDIDGLRAIAVMAVVGFHAFPNWITGGFIGVDIFFVISGFLITTLILGNLDKGSFSFGEFYARRIKRIFPALCLVLLTCITFGWFALRSDEYKQLGLHIIGGAGFISNFLLWREAGYFDSVSDTKPLLHLWSLGIEEQFYILFPPLLFLCHRYRFNLLKILLPLIFLSFGLNIAAVHSHAVAAFYSPGARFWELLIGSLLAWLVLYKKDLFTGMDTKINILTFGTTASRVRNFLSLLSFLVIVATLLAINKETVFPGWWALAPIVGSALIIAGGPEAWVNRTILAHPFLVRCGLFSFPLYLWHWPLLSFLRIGAGSTPSCLVRVMAVIGSVILAELTYRFLERPIRQGKRHKPIVIILCILMVLAAGMGWGVWKFSSRAIFYRRIDVLSAPANAMYDMSKKILLQDNSCKHFLDIDTTNLICKSNSSEPELMILGDSTAPSFNYAAFIGQIPLATLEVGRPGCLPFINFINYGAGEAPEEKKFCNIMNRTAIQHLDRLKSIHTVVLVSSGSLFIRGGFGPKKNEQNWSKYRITTSEGNYQGTNQQAFIDGYTDIIQHLLNTGRHVVFVKEMPEMEESTVDCLTVRPVFGFLHSKPLNCKTDKSVLMEWQSPYNAAVAEIVRQNPGLLVYDPFNLVCDTQSCYGVREDKIFYYDSHHLSLDGSELVLRDFRWWLLTHGINLKNMP